jgi:hypothetical protein
MDYGRANNNGTKLDEPADTSDVDLITLGYAEELRAVGQALEAQTFISVELEVEGDGYRVRAEVDQSKKADSSFGAIVKQLLLGFGSSLQTKKQPTARAIETRYGAEEIQKLIQEGVARRLDTHTVPDYFSLSHILRQTGAYLDGLYHATLVRVTVKGDWITIHYRNGSGQLKEFTQDIQFFYDYWVKMYLRRSDRPVPMLSMRPTYMAALEAELRLKR